MYKNNIGLRVCVNGRAVQEYQHEGISFIESRNGSTYTIKIKNDNAFRVMVIVSVDGLDVITGKSAEDSDKGYIVDSYSTTEIKGYRTSDEKSVSFVFLSGKEKENSYVATTTGNTRNSGVIGIRVFNEKIEPVKVIEKHHYHHDNYWYPKYPWNPWNKPYPYYDQPWGYPYDVIYKQSSMNTMRGCGGGTFTAASNVNIENPVGETFVAPVQNGLVDKSAVNAFNSTIKYDAFDTGTGWGESQIDKVKREYFKKGTLLTELVLYYASATSLTKMGIDLSDTPKISEMPKAFGDSNYCQPPKGWRE